MYLHVWGYKLRKNNTKDTRLFITWAKFSFGPSSSSQPTYKNTGKRNGGRKGLQDAATRLTVTEKADPPPYVTFPTDSLASLH